MPLLRVTIASDNATEDTRFLVAKLNEANSNTAVGQLIDLDNNETAVNLVVDRVTDEDLLGLHQPHDDDGVPLVWLSEEGGQGRFDGEVDLTVNEFGDLVYVAATITIFEARIKHQRRVNLFTGAGEDWELELLKLIVSTFAHEADHNLNLNTIQTIIDRQNGVSNDMDVEAPAEEIEARVEGEIEDNRVDGDASDEREGDG